MTLIKTPLWSKLAGLVLGLMTISPAAAQSNAQRFTWSSLTGSDLRLLPRDTHVCFLTGVSGDLSDYGAVILHRATVDVATVYNLRVASGSGGGTLLDDNGDTWKLGGWNLQNNEVSGEATCVPLSSFIVDEGGGVQVSGHAWAQVNVPEGIDCDLRTSQAQIWQSSAASFVAGVYGGFDGFSEVVKVDMGHTPLDPWVLTVTADSCNVRTEGHAYSILAGIPGANRYPNFTSYQQTLRAESEQTFVQALAKTSDAICYFTSISGDIHGGREKVSIIPQVIGNDEWWVMEVGAGAGKVEGTTSCLSYDQRIIPSPEPDDTPFD